MPAVKKHSSVRARTNRASTAATLSNSTVGPHPSLPALRSWHPMTVEWWDELWSTPMSSEYHISDRHQLIVLAVLYDEFFRTDDLSPNQRKALSEEIRHHRTPFGMTPYDRRKLEWTIELAEDSKDKGSQRRQRQGSVQPKASDDPRRALTAVPNTA